MTFMLIRSKVRDFTTWKTAYDNHLAMRANAGLTEKYLFRSADDANEIVLLFEAQDLNRAKAFDRQARRLLPQRLTRMSMPRFLR